MPEGTVRFFHERKSFGFITRNGPYEDVFFHITDIDGEPPSRGTSVEFSIQYGDRGPRAVDITRTEVQSAGNSTAIQQSRRERS